MDKLQPYIKEEQRRQKEIVRKKVERFIGNPMFSELTCKQNRMILNSINKNGLLLEVGCGYGNFLVDALREMSPDKVVGMDISWENLKVGQDMILNNFSNMFVGMVEDIPFRCSSFDAIVMRGVLHHLSEPNKCLSNLSNLLKPGGILIIMEGDPESWYRKTILGIADSIGLRHEASQFQHLPSKLVITMLEEEFKLIIHQRISGLWYPVAFMGNYIGYTGVYLEWINEFFQKTLPGIFGWWYILVFQKE